MLFLILGGLGTLFLILLLVFVVFSGLGIVVARILGIDPSGAKARQEGWEVDDSEPPHPYWGKEPKKPKG